MLGGQVAMVSGGTNLEGFGRFDGTLVLVSGGQSGYPEWA